MQISTIIGCLATLTSAKNSFATDNLQDKIIPDYNYNDTMLWGTYRPNLYFGTRTRTKETLLTGIAWFGAKSLEYKPWESMFLFASKEIHHI